MAAPSKTWVTIADNQVDADSPGDTTLMTGIRDDLVHLRECLYTPGTHTPAAPHDHDGVNSKAIGSVGIPSAGEYLIYVSPISSAKTSGSTWVPLTPAATIKVGAGGTYRVKFYAKHDAGGGGVGDAKLYKNGATAVGTQQNLTTSYVWYSEDIALASGDTIEVWGSVTSGGTTINLSGYRLCVAAPVIAGALHA